ncbi:hypothetical protein ACLESO_46550 [Pyxidicoccus sp. 3LG]
MSQLLTPEALLQLVYRYFPAGAHVYEERYESSDEFKRLDKLRRAAVEDQGTWTAFLKRVREELPGTRVWDYPNIRYDPAYSARVLLPGYPVGAPEHKEVVLMVSILAPVHILYATHSKKVHEHRKESISYQPPLPSEFQPVAEKVESLAIEAFGTTRLPQDVLTTPVPSLYVGNTGFGKVTLADCLFGDYRW